MGHNCFFTFTGFAHMEIKKIDPDFSVATQITVSNLETIKSMGFNTIICNRFDDEEPQQPSVIDIKKEALSLGFHFVYIPVGSGSFDEHAIKRSKEAIKTSPTPILAYCRSGTRCVILWALANVNNLDRESRIKQMKNAGYDFPHVI